MSASEGLDFVVRKNDFRTCRFVPAAVPGELVRGEVLFRVDRFALTANNVSYALTGDLLAYWSFFPAAEGETWGRIPVMGFGDVLRSAHPDVAEGERYFGFFPMSKHLVVRAEPNAAGLVDTAAHRRRTAPAYRQYGAAKSDPLYESDHEDTLMLLRGLFLTSFLIDDLLAAGDFFGARATVVASASSKTAIALAWLLAERGRTEVVGLTSPRNVAFVEGLRCYDRVVAYGDLASLPRDAKAVFVDMSGNGDVVNGVHRHLGDRVVHSCLVGATHWDASDRAEDLPGARPTFFFAPARIQERSREWGPAGFQERLADAWKRFRAVTDGWLRVVRGAGPEALERAWRDTLEGRTDPREGHVLSLWETTP